MTQRTLRRLFGAGYLLFGAVGLSLLLLHSFRSPADRYVAYFLGSFLALLGAGGLLLILAIGWHDRHRPGPALGVAPSGAPATEFRRSSFLTVQSVAVILVLAGWLAALAVVTHTSGYDIWAALLAAGAAALLGLLGPVVTGKVDSGGLWLTPTGLEYRRDAVGWTLPWNELQHVEPRPGEWTVVGALPYTGGRPVPVEPVVLRLVPGARLERRRTTRWRAWDRECRMPEGTVCIDCVDLAGGPMLIALTIQHYLLFPELRDDLGTAPPTSAVPI